MGAAELILLLCPTDVMVCLHDDPPGAAAINHMDAAALAELRANAAAAAAGSPEATEELSAALQAALLSASEGEQQQLLSLVPGSSHSSPTPCRLRSASTCTSAPLFTTLS